jgi:hypothetical protein
MSQITLYVLGSYALENNIVTNLKQRCHSQNLWVRIALQLESICGIERYGLLNYEDAANLYLFTQRCAL